MDLGNLMGMFGDLKEKMEASKKKLDGIMVNGEAEGVKVTMSASKVISNIGLSDSLVAEGDKEKIEDMIMLAMSKAQEAADNIAHNEASSMAQGGGVDMGGLMDMLKK